MNFDKFKKKVLLIGAFQILVCATAFGATFSVTEKLRDSDNYFSIDAIKVLDAASQGNIPKIKNLIIEGSQIESKGPVTRDLSVQQMTILSYTLGLNDKKSAKTLLLAGANPLYRPSARNGDTFLFLIARKNIAMLDFLYNEFPVEKIPEESQKTHAFTALTNDCIDCIEIMFSKGVSQNIKNENGYNLFMQAMNNESFDTAYWILSKTKMNIKTEALNGVTPSNIIQFFLYKFPAGSVKHAKIMEMKEFVERNHSVKFPVETSLQIRNHRG